MENGVKEDKRLIFKVTQIYSLALLVGFSLLPSAIFSYLYFFQDKTLLFKSYQFHEVAITLSVLAGFIVSFVTWRCYQASGEILLRWLTLGLLGFTVIYAPHGLFTRTAETQFWVFILYGPTSRVVMAACFFIAMLNYGKSNEALQCRKTWMYWAKWSAGFLLVDVIVYFFAQLPIAGNKFIRLSLESAAFCLCLLAVIVMIRRKIKSSIMTVFAVSLLFFAQSSLGFTLVMAWNHLWWLAHAIFLGGFLLLSFVIVQAFHTTRSFASVYSQNELMVQLRAANQSLEKLASTDSLTGINNRREFFLKAKIECSRAKRYTSPLSLLAMDLDRFKNINDRYGHPAGDAVLLAFANRVKKMLRPSDVFGRVGGEEFMILLPETPMLSAEVVAERIRLKVEGMAVSIEGLELKFTVSIGLAQFGVDGEETKDWIGTADRRMYEAKKAGRNQVVMT